MTSAFYIEIILTNKGKPWILVDDFRFTTEKVTKTTWNIKSFFDGKLDHNHGPNDERTLKRRKRSDCKRKLTHNIYFI